jgi:16S rRNA (cytidine1402-2'-O)-methyltransferase
MSSNKGTLYLIPTVISEATENLTLSPQVRMVLPEVRHFLVEEIRTARRFLSSLQIFPSIETLEFSVLDKNTKPNEIAEMMSPVLEGKNIGIISESGCPGVADPGALAVKYAHQLGVKVIPLVGPSSILLALMASGLNGQRFAFLGYLPVESRELSKSLKQFEKESKAHNQTQIFIETPYRNNSLLKNLLNNLNPETRLTIAVDLTGVDSFIQTKTIKEWAAQRFELPKRPAVFLFLA